MIFGVLIFDRVIGKIKRGAVFLWTQCIKQYMVMNIENCIGASAIFALFELYQGLKSRLDNFVLEMPVILHRSGTWRRVH